MTMTPLKHQRLIANAGSGKTYRLVTRYLELLRHNVSPERIIALTFTRKAAGEFMDRIFQRLHDGIAGGDAESGLSATECATHLRRLVDSLPRLALGTLDSFLGRMVRAFPFECGLAGDLTLMDGHGLDLARREALEALFRDQCDDAAFPEFLELIRQQNRNSEKRNVTDALQREINSLHEAFLLTPPEKRWGEPSSIWPQGCAILDAGELPPLVDDFESALAAHHPDLDEKFEEHWNLLLLTLRNTRAGSVVAERALKFARKAMDPPSPPKDSTAFYLTVFGNKRFAFPESRRALFEALGLAILRVEIEGRLARSRALYDLLAGFEDRYQRLIRNAGRLTFTDVTGLLAAAEGASWAGAGTVRVLDRQQMNFRLDATYDHWLFDEFQDTSRLQWQALRNLVDEVVQSDSGERSFFYVGDTKQAIYTWRGGDPRLFEEIAAHYNASGTQRIDTSEALDISRRSAPEILDAVNHLFAPEHLTRLRDDMGFPSETLARWDAAWRPHQPDDRHPAGQGCVDWRTFEDGEDGKRATLDQETARLIADIDPLSKGLTCAVLVQSNATAASVIDALRAAGLEARSEGRFNPCTDNEFGSAMMSLLRALAHPADTWALQHIRMTPLRTLVGENFSDFRGPALTRIREEGFAGAIADWFKSLPIEDNPFALNRAAIFVRAAAEFEAATCGATIDDLVGALQNESSADEPAGGAIRVLTIHAAKGLDFDMVVLPELDTSPLASARTDAPIHLHHEGEGGIEWGLDLPKEEVCQMDPTLESAFAERLIEGSYEKLCLYYVALTRAKFGLYLLSRELKADSKDKKFNALLHKSLPIEGGRYLQGNPDWHLNHIPADAAQPAKFLPLAGAVHRDLRPESPTGSTDRLTSATKLLGPRAALALGSEVHRALAGVTWRADGSPVTEDLSSEASVLVEAFWKSEIACELYTPPGDSHRLWREQPFDVLVDDQWVSGIFDRVVLQEDRAEIIDYKTDDNDAEEPHRHQMGQYRRCLAALTGIAPDAIAASLVFVRSGRKVSVSV